jgi:hypothetical protein
VETRGVEDLHAALSTESRTRGQSLAARSRKSGYAPVGMTREGLLRFGRLATWMDRVTNDYFARPRLLLAVIELALYKVSYLASGETVAF